MQPIKINREALERIQRMRAELDQVERHIKKGQLFGAYTALGQLHSRVYNARLFLSDKTLKAAMNWGCAVSMRDKNGKHEGWAILDERPR